MNKQEDKQFMEATKHGDNAKTTGFWRSSINLNAKSTPLKESKLEQGLVIKQKHDKHAKAKVDSRRYATRA